MPEAAGGSVTQLIGPGGPFTAVEEWTMYNRKSTDGPSDVQEVSNMRHLNLMI